jgi:uncharacterized membrane protein YeiH
MDQINFWIGIIATVAFAVTGVLAIADRGVDLFGVMVLGVITAIGGGTLRDIILDVPAFWSIAQIYIWVALGACVVTFVAESFFTQPQFIAGCSISMDLALLCLAFRGRIKLGT